MKLNPNVRNVLIIVAVATVIYAVPTANSGFTFVVTVVSLGFLAALAWIANRLYREHRIELYSLGTRRRAVLYIALGVATLTVSANDRLRQTGFGTLVWLLLLAACAYAIYAVYRSTKEY